MTSQFRNFDAPSRSQELSIQWERIVQDDDCPDVSWLEADSGRYADEEDADVRAECEAQDAERLAAFHVGDWSMVGVIARAHVAVPIGSCCFATYTLDSPGVWGVESDAGDYLDKVFAEQKAELLSHLRTMAHGIDKLAA